MCLHTHVESMPEVTPAVKEIVSKQDAGNECVAGTAVRRDSTIAPVPVTVEVHKLAL